MESLKTAFPAAQLRATPVHLAAAALVFAAAAHGGGFTRLFDGATTRGWHMQGDGAWHAGNGVLIGTHAAASPAFGHLVSDSAYSDFQFRYRWKLVKGNSGLYYHSAEGSSAGMIGPQVEMDGDFPGGIYTTSTDPWGWVVQPGVGEAAAWFKPGDWNLVTVTAKGPRVTVSYNGIVTADTVDAGLPVRGHFGFQVHANLDCEIQVMDVEIALQDPVTLGRSRVLPDGRSGGRRAAIPSSTVDAMGRAWAPGPSFRFGPAFPAYRTSSRSGGPETPSARTR
jgi:hypothetical protein